MSNFQHKFRTLCKKTGMNQKDLASRLKVTYSAVNQWANGKRIPKGRTVMKIAQVLGVPFTALVDMPAEVLSLLCGFQSVLEKLNDELDRLGMADAGNVALGEPGCSDKIEDLDEWITFFENLYDDAAAFMIDHAYPLAEDYDYFCENVGRQDDADYGESGQHNEENAASASRDDVLDAIQRRMLSDLETSGIRQDQYRLLENVCPHIFRAACQTIQHAAESVYMPSAGAKKILRLYGKLNAEGQETAEKRLDELAQLPLYAASPEEA